MKTIIRLAVVMFLIFSIVVLISGCDLLFGKVFSLSFNANDGSGTMNPVVLKADQQLQLPANSFTRTGYSFGGWATSAAGIVEYADEASFTMGSSDIILYAVWALSFAGGEGSQADPYQIGSAAQLSIVRNHLDKYFVLTNDIDLSDFASGDGWEPIGTESNPFTGCFDGGGFEISNLFINRTAADHVGLFGYARGAEFSDVSLVDVNVSGKMFVGGFVGQAKGTDFDDIQVDGEVSGYDKVGGLFGLAEKLDSTGCTIASSSSEGTVTGETFMTGGLGGWLNYSSASTSSSAAAVTGGDDYIGGLFGFSQGSTVSQCFATGNVIGVDYVGGLVGSHSMTGTISNSFASGSVTGNDKVGGLVGGKTYDPEVKKCYAVGAVSGTSNTGGLIGSPIFSAGTVADSYYDKDITGQTDNGKGIGKTTAEMQQKATFTDWDFQLNPFDTFYTWDIDEGAAYPHLHWASR